MATPSGEIYLLKNIVLTPSYEHTIDFKDKAEQWGYFKGFIAHTLTNYTYIRKERESITVPFSMNDLDDINYLIFRSDKDGRWYFCFVQNKLYSAPNQSIIFYSIDVFQTYMFDYKWQQSYISKAHVDRWDSGYKPIYSKTEEGLDYGTEYIVESGYKIQQPGEMYWLLVSMVFDDGIHLSDVIYGGGYLGPASSPFVNLLVPLPLQNANDIGTTEAWVKIGDTGISSYSSLIKFMNNSAFGNYVRGITLLTYNPFISNVNFTGNEYIVTLHPSVDYSIRSFTVGEETSSISALFLNDVPNNMLMGSQVLARTEWDTGLKNSLPTAEEWEEIKSKPYTTPRDKRFESKLLCAPYRYNLLTDWRGNPVIYKNEYMTTDMIEVLFSFALSVNAPFRYWIKGYKNDIEGRTTTLSQAMGLEFPVISDAYYTYMLENKNTIQANLTNAIMSAGTGIISGVVSGGLGGGIMAGLNGTVSVAQQQISENAKQHDLKAKPDTVINSTDSSFNVYDKNVGVSFYRMKICCENELIISNIFNMYGYHVNKLEIPNTRSRARFNYIKTIGANLTGSINQLDLLHLKSIFDNGITIWHYNKDDFNYLDYSYENMEVSLL